MYTSYTHYYNKYEVWQWRNLVDTKLYTPKLVY